jgi:hypothetical protein
MLSEIEQVDLILAKDLNENERKRLWVAADRILKHRAPGGSATGLALGYVQSGKTTQMIALTAAAYDDGYRVVVSLF